MNHRCCRLNEGGIESSQPGLPGENRARQALTLGGRLVFR